MCATISTKHSRKFEELLMSEHHATIVWQRSSTDYTYETYNRAHEWRIAGNNVPASAAKDFRGDSTRVNPEEAYVASLSSCHMLTFLAIAAKRKVPLDSYHDEAVGYLEKNQQGRLAITRVSLRPKIVWSTGVSVSSTDLDKMHHEAHEGCFIANSVKTEITVDPRA
jgi:organic hydroperoxide reductase OsmC/OhrA